MSAWVDQSGALYFGQPKPGDRPATEQELAAYQITKGQAERDAVLEEAKLVRISILAILAGLQSEALTTGDTDTAEAIITAQVGLRNLQSNPLVTNALGRQETEEAIAAVYWALVEQLPTNVKTAFNQVKP